MSDFAKCASCSTEIVWTVTAAGKRMPVDAAPVDNGNLFVFIPKDPTAPLLSLSSLSLDPRCVEARLHDRPRFVSHFATCPNAPKHRKGKA